MTEQIRKRLLPGSGETDYIPLYTYTHRYAGARTSSVYYHHASHFETNNVFNSTIVNVMASFHLSCSFEPIIAPTP